MSLLSFLLSGSSGSAPTTQTIAVTDANLFFSPYNTYSDGGGAMGATNIKASSTYALMVTTGAYLKFRVTVASGGAGYVALTLDTTRYNGLTASTCPTLSYSYDKRPFTNVLLAYSATDVTQVLANGLAAGTYDFEVHFKSLGTTAYGSGADRWTTPAYAVKIDGIVIDSTASIPSQTLRPNRLLTFGASYTEGVNITLANNDSANDVVNEYNNARLSFAALVAYGLDAEYGHVAYGGQAFERGIGNAVASSTNPSFYSATAANQSWDKYFASTSRDITSPEAPDYILIDHGFNDQGSLPSASVTAVLDAIRTAVGSTAWMFQVGQNGDDDAAIITGVANVASTARTKYIAITDLVTENTPSEYSGDAAFGGSHPNTLGQALRATQLLNEMQEYISAAGGGSVALEPVGTAMHKGDFDTSAVVYGKFTTRQPSTGAAFTLGGTPALSVYKDNSTTQSTAGVTLTVGFDSVTGCNHYAIDTSADGTFYSAGSTFDVVITAGTVDSVSVVGTVVGSFSIRAKGAVIRNAVGLASANLDTQLTAIDDLIDTEVAAIKTVVDSILVDTAEIGAAGAGLTALATQASVNTIDDFLDTEVAAILAAVDTEVAAIKAKTDQLTFGATNTLNANITHVKDRALELAGADNPEYGVAP